MLSRCSQAKIGCPARCGAAPTNASRRRARQGLAAAAKIGQRGCRHHPRGIPLGAFPYCADIQRAFNWSIAKSAYVITIFACENRLPDAFVEYRTMSVSDRFLAPPLRRRAASGYAWLRLDGGGACGVKPKSAITRRCAKTNRKDPIRANANEAFAVLNLGGL